MSPRTFDTGLTKPQRTLVQDAFIARLQRLHVANGGFLEAIIPISFRVDAQHLDTIDLLLQEIDTKSPAIAIAPLDLHPHQAGGPGKAIGDLEVELYFLSRHRKGIVTGRARGDAIADGDLTADPGIYATMELARVLLFDAPLGIPSVHEPKLHSEHELITAEEHTIWRQEWRILLGLDANLYRDIMQRLTSFHTTLRQPSTDEPVGKRIVEDTIVG